MEWITVDGETAPRLSQTRPVPDLLTSYFEQLRESMATMAQHGIVHGDLSAYNLLAAGDRLVIIDLPQVVDLVGNPQGMDFLLRDCANVCALVPQQGTRPDDRGRARVVQRRARDRVLTGPPRRATVISLLRKRSDSSAVRAAIASESGYDESLWQAMCEQVCVTALPIPEEYDGFGASFVETAVVLEELRAQPCALPAAGHLDRRGGRAPACRRQDEDFEAVVHRRRARSPRSPSTSSCSMLLPRAPCSGCVRVSSKWSMTPRSRRSSRSTRASGSAVSPGPAGPSVTWTSNRCATSPPR